MSTDGVIPALDGDRAFGSDVVDRVRAAGNVWALPGGELRLPRAFGFCRGVERALEMLQEAVAQADRKGERLFLLGQIIHNPWVNEHFARRGVRILAREDLDRLSDFVGPDDCAVIPAFGVTPDVETRLADIGCDVIDTTCGNVHRLWAWAKRAVADGRGVLIFGRPRHDETMVTKSRLAAAGGAYVVVSDVEQARMFCELVTGELPAGRFPEVFGPEATNADSPAPFARLAQVSQTTMLYDETMRIRELVREAFERQFAAGGEQRLLFEPTVCRATQDRQQAAVELCREGLHLAVVVGGFGSSNTRHLHEVARQYVPAVFIEDADAIRSSREVVAFDPETEGAQVVPTWLPEVRPARIGVLAGASSPEVVVGQVLERLAGFLS